MNKINFRKANIKDVNSIYSIIKSIGDLERNFSSLNEKQVKEKIKLRIKKQNRFISVLEINNKVIGYSSFRPFDKFPYSSLVNKKLDKRFAYGSGIAIHKNHQGKGYGKKIRIFSLEEAKKEGFAGMYVIIEPTNEISIKLHKERSFNKIGEITKENGEKRILIAKKF